MSKDQVKASVEARYDVSVLRINAVKVDGKNIFRVKVMYNAGDWNTAFQVNTFMIDGVTGKRIVQFRHHSSGRTLAETKDVIPNRQKPGALRGHIWR